MGRMVAGQWTTQWYEPDSKGRFVRAATTFHHQITRDGSSGFPAAVGRYHLYVSHACPWAHRTLILRALKGLEHAIGVTVVDPKMGDDGWYFSDGPGCAPDPILGVPYLREVYRAADPQYTGRVTVPVLWDKQTSTIVNNESREIVRMFDHAFVDCAKSDVDYAPPHLTDEVERVMDAIYAPINNGVYRCGFATTQGAYDEAVDELFSALDHWDEVLGVQRFTCGDTPTEADVFFFTTLARFDLVYYTHFKCNRRHIWEYPNLWRFSQDLLALPGVADTCHWDHMKLHYFWSHPSINPHRIVPDGPARHLGSPDPRPPR